MSTLITICDNLWRRSRWRESFETVSAVSVTCEASYSSVVRMLTP